MDARGAETRALSYGRRNRLVLHPSSRCQACGDKPQARVAIERGSPGRSRISCKPLCGECRVSGVTVAHYAQISAAGASAPGIPAPFGKEGGSFLANLGQSVSRDRICTSLRGAKRRSNPAFFAQRKERWIASLHSQ